MLRYIFFSIQLSVPSIQSVENKMGKLWKPYIGYESVRHNANYTISKYPLISSLANRSNSGNTRPEHFSDYPDKQEVIRSFYGAPSSCQDLLQLGYQISGFYFVKGLNNKETKIETVFCDFNWKENYPGIIDIYYTNCIRKF